MSKEELADWYSNKLSKSPGHSKMGYAGTSRGYHYFIARPVDSFVYHRVARSELTLADERTRSTLGLGLYFYLLDPSKNFEKVPE